LYLKAESNLYLLLNPKELPMDIAALTALLAPFLPSLMKLGNKAAEAAAGKLGEDAWNKAKAVWEKLHPKVEAKEAALEAATDVAAAPEDEDSLASLRKQLKKILDNDPTLAQEIAQLMQEDAATGSSGTAFQQNVTGNQNKTVGQMQGSGKFAGNVDGNVTM
jgi:hypothetical protein